MPDEPSTPFEGPSDGTIERFRTDGKVKLKNALSPASVRHYGAAIKDVVESLNQQDLPIRERSTYGKALLQVTNLWEHSATVRAHRGFGVLRRN